MKPDILTSLTETGNSMVTSSFAATFIELGLPANKAFVSTMIDLFVLEFCTQIAF